MTSFFLSAPVSLYYVFAKLMPGSEVCLRSNSCWRSLTGCGGLEDELFVTK